MDVNEINDDNEISNYDNIFQCDDNEITSTDNVIRNYFISRKYF